MLWLLVVFGGGTVGLFVIITLFALLTARKNYVPPAPGSEIHVRTDTIPHPAPLILGSAPAGSDAFEARLGVSAQ